MIPKFILPQNRQKATPATGFLHNLKITGFGSENTGKKHKNSAAELWKIHNPPPIKDCYLRIC
jgi:hypothetical protein